MSTHPWKKVQDATKRRNDKMLTMYKKGHSIRAIAKEMGSTYGKVYYQIEKAGIPFRKAGRPINEQADEEVVSVYKDTNSMYKTAKLTGCSWGTVKNTLIRRGVL